MIFNKVPINISKTIIEGKLQDYRDLRKWRHDRLKSCLSVAGTVGVKITNDSPWGPNGLWYEEGKYCYIRTMHGDIYGIMQEMWGMPGVNMNMTLAMKLHLMGADNPNTNTNAICYEYCNAANGITGHFQPMNNLQNLDYHIWGWTWRQHHHPQELVRISEAYNYLNEQLLGRPLKPEERIDWRTPS